MVRKGLLPGLRRSLNPWGRNFCVQVVRKLQFVNQLRWQENTAKGKVETASLQGKQQPFTSFLKKFGLQLP
jgi:hypothetical protein